MNVMEKFCAAEPHWILDRMDSGSLYWRRDHAGNNFRVKFRCDVEVKEFQRSQHELKFMRERPQDYFDETSSPIAMGVTAVLCFMITVLLPWYIIGIN